MGKQSLLDASVVLHVVHLRYSDMTHHQSSVALSAVPQSYLATTHKSITSSQCKAEPDSQEGLIHHSGIYHFWPV